jgi:hypothetical protein
MEGWVTGSLLISIPSSFDLTFQASASDIADGGSSGMDMHMDGGERNMAFADTEARRGYSHPVMKVEVDIPC